MARLCRDSSRSYLGSSAQTAVWDFIRVGLRALWKRIDHPPNPAETQTARLVATLEVIGQKSAEVIVAKRSS